jgi:hypothetical protein
MDDSGRLHHALLRSGLCRAVNCERLPRTPNLCISNTFQLILLIFPVISLIQPRATGNTRHGLTRFLN